MCSVAWLPKSPLHISSRPRSSQVGLGYCPIHVYICMYVYIYIYTHTVYTWKILDAYDPPILSLYNPSVSFACVHATFTTNSRRPITPQFVSLSNSDGIYIHCWCIYTNCSLLMWQRNSAVGRGAKSLSADFEIALWTPSRFANDSCTAAAELISPPSRGPTEIDIETHKSVISFANSGHFRVDLAVLIEYSWSKSILKWERSLSLSLLFTSVHKDLVGIHKARRQIPME